VPDPPANRRRRRVALAAAIAACALAAVIIAVVALGSGGSSGDTASTPAEAAVTARPQVGAFRGGVLDPPRPAPALDLRTASGARVDLSRDRGKAVLVTFLYTQCPDVCPLIATRLSQALDQLGPRAADARLIAVSVDPKGDTPAHVTRFLRTHHLTGRMQYAIGSAAQLRPTWKRWGVLAVTDTTNANLVNHSALVYGIDGSGRITTIYPSNLRPTDVAHDIPVLASR
jgi:protein SCO1/2